MKNETIIYGDSPLGLLFIPEARVLEMANYYRALVTAKNWGEFREMVTKAIYEKYLPGSVHYHGPYKTENIDIMQYYIPDETPFTPNDVFTYDNPPGHPEIEMTAWMPDEIQEKFARRFKYYAMDGNAPGGEALELDKTKLDKILQIMEKEGFDCRRDDELITAATTCDFNPDDYDNPYEEEV
jgi:hypothetical protein